MQPFFAVWENLIWLEHIIHAPDTYANFSNCCYICVLEVHQLLTCALCTLYFLLSLIQKVLTFLQWNLEDNEKRQICLFLKLEFISCRFTETKVLLKNKRLCDKQCFCTHSIKSKGMIQAWWSSDMRLFPLKVDKLQKFSFVDREKKQQSFQPRWNWSGRESRCWPVWS